MTTVTETLTNPPTAIMAGVGTVATNALVLTLPVVINIIMAVYLSVLVIHKCWQFYNEIKERRAKRKRNDTAF